MNYPVLDKLNSERITSLTTNESSLTTIDHTMTEQEKNELPYFKYKTPVTGIEVYHWPEFIALAKRLGIQWGNPTQDLNIFIPAGNELVKITHEYNAMDTKVLKKPIPIPPKTLMVPEQDCDTVEIDYDKLRKYQELLGKDITITDEDTERLKEALEKGIKGDYSQVFIGNTPIEADKPIIKIEEQKVNPFEKDWK